MSKKSLERRLSASDIGLMLAFRAMHNDTLRLCLEIPIRYNLTKKAWPVSKVRADILNSYSVQEDKLRKCGQYKKRRYGTWRHK